MKISTINTMLIANASGFVAGCKQAEKAAGDLASRVGSIAGGMAAYEIGKGLAQSAYANTVGLVKGQLEAIDSTAKLSDTLGISTEALTRLQYAASYSGTSNEDLANGLLRLNKVLGGTADDAEGASNAFSKIGLDADKLMSMKPEARFAAVGDALNGMGNAAERNAAASAIFGKGFAPLMPLLKEGSEGLKKFGDEADKMGFSFNRMDAAKVEQANDAIQKLTNMMTSLGTQIAIGVAPYLTGIADALAELGPTGASSSDIITNGLQMVAEAVAVVSGTIDLFEGVWYSLKGTVLAVAAGVIQEIDAIGSTVVKLLNLIPGVSVEWESLADVATGMAEQAKEAFGQAGDSFSAMANGDRAESVRSFFESVKRHADESAAASANAANHVGEVGAAAAESAKKVVESIAKLKEQVAQFGMTDGQKIASDLKAQGATPEQIAQTTAAQDQLDRLKVQKKAQDDAAAAAKKYNDDTRTASEKYADEVQRINDLVAQGALDADTAARATAKAQEDLDKASGDKKKTDTPDGPKLLQAGSQEAASFVSSIQRRDAAGTEQKTLVAQSKQGNKYLEQVVKNTTPGTGGIAELTVVTF